MIHFFDKKHLRRLLREQRSMISPTAQQQISLKIAQTIIRLQEFRAAKRIACYLAQENEIDMLPVMQKAWESNKKIYLPVIQSLKKGTMDFYEYEENDPLIENRVHIQEPEKHTEKLTYPWTLDLVMMPIVGFDEACHRLGRGGGYYDQTFSFLKNAEKKHRPFLIGVAYEFQKVENINANEWDINPDIIVTEEKIYSNQ